MAKVKGVNKLNYQPGRSLVYSCEQCGLVPHWQDQRYGRGRRVHNVGIAKAGDTVKITCTVCGNVTYTNPAGIAMLQKAGLQP